MTKRNQKIKCNVSSCKFQNSDYCTLKEILVGAMVKSNQVQDNDETLCRSFECDHEKGEA